MTDDYPLGNLKFVNKVEVDEVFRMPIPKDLITDAIRNSNYYKKYLEMAARKPRQPTTMIGEEVEKKKQAPKAGKSKQPTPAEQLKPVKKKISKPTPSKKIHKGKRSDHLVDEEDEEGQPASEPQVEDDEYNLKRGIQMSLESLQAPIDGVVVREPDPGFIQKLPDVKGNGKGRRTPVTHDASTRPSVQPQDDTSANVVHDTSSPTDSTNNAETAADMEQSNSENNTEILNVVEEQGEEVSNTMALDERTAGPNYEPMHEDFIATVYPEVRENLKLTTEEQVHLENPPSSSVTLLSMKNLKDAFTFGDQFINDKSTKEEPRKANVESEVESMVIVPIHQASSSVPPLSNPIINLSPPKLVSPPVQEPIFTTTTATTTTLPPPPPPPLQSITDLDLATYVFALEIRSADFEQKNKQDNSSSCIQALTKSCKRRCDDQDPPPTPPKDSDQKAPLSYSKKKLASLFVQPVNDNLIPDDMHLSKLEDGELFDSDFLRALEELVPSLWTKSESSYDISSAYGISHCWFKCKEFYITRHSAPSDRNAVRSYMKILSVVSLKAFSKYGYIFLKEIVLRRVDYKEYKISEADFKNLHPNDFGDMYLLNLQGKLNHLSGAEKVHLSTAVVYLWLLCVNV
ncbi:hypothetical protein Tco_1546407 [Tanacetum coccineum]